MRCKDCRYWDKHSHECDLVEWLEDYKNAKKDEFILYATASDDQGLTAALLCGPDFGCVKGVPKCS